MANSFDSAHVDFGLLIGRQEVGVEALSGWL